MTFNRREVRPRVDLCKFEGLQETSCHAFYKIINLCFFLWKQWVRGVKIPNYFITLNKMFKNVTDESIAGYFEQKSSLAIQRSNPAIILGIMLQNSLEKYFLL